MQVRQVVCQKVRQVVCQKTCQESGVPENMAGIWFARKSGKWCTRKSVRKVVCQKTCQASGVPESQVSGVPESQASGVPESLCKREGKYEKIQTKKMK